MRKAGEISALKKSYLDKKKQQSSGKTVPNSSYYRLYERTTTKPKELSKITRNKVNNGLNDLPNELLFKVFKYLDVKSLLSCASVCKRWQEIADDDSFWKVFYTKYVFMNAKKFAENVVKEPASPLEAEKKYWKKRFFTKSKQMRDKSFLGLSKINPYTGVTDKIQKHFEKLGAKFQLCFSTKGGQTFNFIEKKRQIYLTSTMLQWHSLKTWPDLKKIIKVQIFSLTPFVHGEGKNLIKNGPRQKSLVFEEKLDDKLFDAKNKFVANDQIDVYTTNSGILISVWKDTLDVAFICASLHHDLLLKKCLMSTSDTIYLERHTVKPGVLDKSYGLHGYWFHLQLTLGEKDYWDLRIHSDECDNNTDSSMISFTKTNNVSSAFDATGLSWKTDLFHGNLKNVSFLTITAVDINSDVMWSSASPVKHEFSSNAVVNFDQDSDKGLRMVYNDNIGHIELFFIDSGRGYSLERLTVALNLKIVNSWFGMRH
uniref:F-box only protein 15-like n=1 Tax=Styela clava TaxID=7725 RepID=UPI001939FE29|nr:F-box only protein 15-like [Styela clava]